MKNLLPLCMGIAFATLTAVAGCNADHIDQDKNQKTGGLHGTNHVDRATDAHGLSGLPNDSSIQDTTGTKGVEGDNLH